ncbi:MAG: hypothetical protein AB7R89_31405 [Dehalococcoidia bacterium]
MIFEVWNIETANLLGTYPDRDSALNAMQEAVEAYGESFIATCELAQTDQDGRTVSLGRGQAIINQALLRIPQKPAS